VPEKFSRKFSVIVEEKFDGEEFSLQCLCDGRTVVGTPWCRIIKGDSTATRSQYGRHGSYSLADHLLPFPETAGFAGRSGNTRQVAKALAYRTGRPYKGVMYGGFIATKKVSGFWSIMPASAIRRP